MAQTPESIAATTFLLLKAIGTRPIITDTSSSAGEAFNQTLRAIASLPQHHSQLFGWKEFIVNSIKADADDGLVWDSKFFGFREGGAENATNEHASGETLIWVISRAFHPKGYLVAGRLGD
jgi:hypothetical protein